MPAPTAQRAFALEILQKLRAAGFEALWAGGCVRDELLGLAPKDYDVATSATPDQIRELFGRRRTLAIGAAFGVVTVLGPRRPGTRQDHTPGTHGQLDVATFRTDAAYSDGRHPDSVTFTDAQHDAQRRDFTINGLFYDPVAEQVIDYVGGQEDLQKRIIRAIGNPRLRLSEDKLRMLRAVRFAATFKFTIDPATMRAIQQMSPDITTVSAERIGMEIRRMLLDPNRAAALRLLRESNLLSHVLTELAVLSEDAWRQTLDRMARLRAPTLSLALAALLLSVDAANVHEVGRRLRYTNKETDRAGWLLGNLVTAAHAPAVPWPRLQRVLVHDGAAELVALAESFNDPNDEAPRFCRERLAWPAERLNPPPLVDGADLIRHGLTPGPQFSALLEQIRDAQLSGEIATLDEALALADRLRAGGESLP
jgi:tRNA nucleotidyltransferase/poly(A) polymerase